MIHLTRRQAQCHHIANELEGRIETKSNSRSIKAKQQRDQDKHKEK